MIAAMASSMSFGNSDATTRKGKDRAAENEWIAFGTVAYGIWDGGQVVGGSRLQLEVQLLLVHDVWARR